MKIAVCTSLDFTYEVEKLANELRQRKFDVTIPITSDRILRGELTLAKIREEKESGVFSERAIQHDSIRAYWNVINISDVVLVANYDKKGIKGYIGGNVFLEMGFAHVLNKKIFLLHEIPEVSYSDEIRAMQPIILSGDLSRIV